MKVLVTGGSGFMGSALLNSLPPGIKAVSFDHGKNYPLLKKILKENITLVRGDLEDSRALDKVMNGVDIVYHLAGVSGERLCLSDPIAAVCSNVLATQNVVRSAMKFGIKKLIFASSYWVYPVFKTKPACLSEDNRGQVSDSFYGNLKIASEEIIKNSVLPYTILRFANVYGYGSGIGSQWRGLIGTYILSAFENKPIIVYGDGSQKIDIIHIDDVLKAFKYFMDSDYVINNIYNVGSGSPVTVLDIARCIRGISKDILNCKSSIKKIKAPSGKVWPDKWLNINRITRLVQGYPEVTLEKGVLEIISRLSEVKKDDSTLYKTILQQKRY